MSDNFAEVINKAQEVPRKFEDAYGDLLSPFPPGVDPSAVKAHTDGLPAFDYESHTLFFAFPKDLEDYDRIINMALRGDALIRFEERHVTKDGDAIVIISYLTKQRNAEKEAEAKKKKEEEAAEQERNAAKYNEF